METRNSTARFKVFPGWMYLGTQSILCTYIAKLVDDALHMANHVRESFERDYPKVLKEVQENLDSPNREAAEQTFVWPGQSKKK